MNWEIYKIIWIFIGILLTAASWLSFLDENAFVREDQQIRVRWYHLPGVIVMGLILFTGIGYGFYFVIIWPILQLLS